jgi:zinc transport system substrate-binding protein
MRTRKVRVLWMGTLFAIILCFVFVMTVALKDVHCKDLPTIYVVNYPLKFFAERIAGRHARVMFPAPSDEDPAFWAPGPDTIAAYQKADLILLNGAGYATWVDKASLPKSKTLDTSSDFKEQYIKIEGAVTHSHGAERKHAHKGVAFTTWIDFNLARRQALAVGEAMYLLRPGLRQDLLQNFVLLEKDLKEIDEAIQRSVSANPTQPLIGSHPVYDYFSRRYGLNMKSVHWEPDEVPSDAQWTELQALLNYHPAKWMIWEGEPMRTSVDKLAALGIKSLVFDPCGNVPDQGDFLSVMKQNVLNLEAAFQ